MPLLAFGFASFHQSFTSTISLAEQTFSNVIGEVLRELVRQGFTKISIFNGHRDNQSIIDEKIVELNRSSRDVTILNPVYATLRTTTEFTKKYPDRKLPKTISCMEKLVEATGLLRHADATELSLYLALYPEKEKEILQLLKDVPSLPDLHSILPNNPTDWPNITKPCRGGTGDPRGYRIDLAQEVIASMMNEVFELLFSNS